MHLIVDDHEKHVIPVLRALHEIKVQRITVGDYVYVHGDKIICIVERKSITDLTASIKDGRMNNHNKLLEAKEKCACIILYIIEGPAYPNLNRSFARMKFKCLQEELDSIMFSDDIKIIWTKNIIHTAERLAGLCKTFEKFVDKGIFSNIIEQKGCENGIIVEENPPLNMEKVNSIVNIKHEVNLDMLHVNMLRQVKGVSYKASVVALQHFNIKQLLLCKDVTSQNWYNFKNLDSMYRLGNRGMKMFNSCKKVNECPETQIKILSQINGITKTIAGLILQNLDLTVLLDGKFEKNIIADIKKKNNRRIGKAIEGKISMAFV
jgi:ERCC4-type nuclease